MSPSLKTFHVIFDEDLHLYKHTQKENIYRTCNTLLAISSGRVFGHVQTVSLSRTHVHTHIHKPHTHLLETLRLQVKNNIITPTCPHKFHASMHDEPEFRQHTSLAVGGTGQQMKE